MSLYEKLFEAGQDLKEGEAVFFFKHNDTIYYEELNIIKLDVERIKGMIKSAQSKPHKIDKNYHQGLKTIE